MLLAGAAGLSLAAMLALHRSEKLRYFLYKEINYQYLSDRICRGANSDDEKALRVAHYVSGRLASVGNEVIDKDSWNDLVRGIAWCDQQAWVLATLLARQDVPARLAMLFNRQGISNHSVAEVLTGNGWSVFDPTTGIVLRHPRTGQFATLQQITQAPEILKKNARYLHFPPAHRAKIDLWYDGILHRPLATVRWTPATESRSASWPRRFLNAAVRGLVRLGGAGFVHAYQDFHLARQAAKTSFAGTSSAARQRLEHARNYEVLGRTDLAREHYRKLMERFPATSEADEARFFLSRIYLDAGRFREAEGLLAPLQKTKCVWKPAIPHYLAAAQDGLRRHNEAARLRRLSFKAGTFQEIVSIP